MGRLVDLDDITDAAGVADMLGLSNRNAVREYRQRYETFPEPVLEMGAGRCLLWLRSEVAHWLANDPRRRRSRKT